MINEDQRSSYSLQVDKSRFIEHFWPFITPTILFKIYPTTQLLSYPRFGTTPTSSCRPVVRDKVYKEIFEQVENFKKYQGG